MIFSISDASKITYPFLIVILIMPGCQVRESVEPMQGRTLYLRHCASCHGQDGEGEGPVAVALQQPPSDLTRLHKAEPPKDSIQSLMRAINGTRTIRAHGESQMPVWGEVFNQELQNDPHARRTALLKVQSIAEYVHTLQRKD